MKQHSSAVTDDAHTSAAVERVEAASSSRSARAPQIAIWADGRVAWTLQILCQEPPFGGGTGLHQPLQAKIKRLGLDMMSLAEVTPKHPSCPMRAP